MADFNAKDLTIGAIATGGLVTGITALANKVTKGSGNCGNGYNNGNGEDCYITRMESQLRAENAELRADQKTDAKILDLFKVVANNKEEAGKQIAENAVQIALNKQASDYQFAILDERIKVGDEGVKNWVLMQDYVPGKLVMPIDKVCPQPLPACAPVSIQGAIIDTTETKTTATVVGNKKA